MSPEEIEKELAARSVMFARVDDSRRSDIIKAWHETFAVDVKRQTGNWVHKGFRWHAFSYAFTPALSGPEAVAAYQRQWQADFVVFDESGDWCVAATAAEYPDLTALRQDLYVAHANMKWTMVFTHEEGWHGPYFAERQ